MTEKQPLPGSIEVSQRTGQMRRQAFALSELLNNFLDEYPDARESVDNDQDLTPEQIELWDAYSADLLAYYQSDQG